jgi:hypothetical protein
MELVEVIRGEKTSDGAAPVTHTPGLEPPMPTVVSCVTVRVNYDARTARDILVRWVDYPQLLWDVIPETPASGVELVVHVGRASKLIASTAIRTTFVIKVVLEDWLLVKNSRLDRGDPKCL